MMSKIASARRPLFPIYQRCSPANINQLPLYGLASVSMELFCRLGVVSQFVWHLKRPRPSFFLSRQQRRCTYSSINDAIAVLWIRLWLIFSLTGMAMWWLATTVWWLTFTSLHSTTSWMTVGSVITVGNNGSNVDVNITTTATTPSNKPTVVTSGESCFLPYSFSMTWSH